MTNKRLLSFLFGGALLAIGAGACGSSDNLFTGSTGTGGSTGKGGSSSTSTGGHGGSGGSGGGTTTGGGGAGGCKSAADCTDAFSCTLDTCVDGSCTHAVGPNSGATACPPGQFCELTKGCVPGVVCANDAQCQQQLGGDACKVAIACDAAMAICTYQTLDKDGDGHPPIVCGGDDCDDGDTTVFAGHPEVCDGKDNDCSGSPDDGATCPGMATCQAGQCVCPPEDTCNGACVDKTSDPKNCGTCGNACPSGASCVSGQCQCGAMAVVCNGVCVDLKTDPNNCNGCGNTCAAGYACANGTCTCQQTSCGGACVDIDTDASHCGNCTTVCPSGSVCQGGQCKCPAGLTQCGGACVDTKTDPKNCGMCNTSCGSCQNGTCITCPVSDLFISQDMSGSMSTTNASGITRWDAVRNALSAFVTDPLSGGLGIGIGYYGLPSTTAPTCVTATDCLVYGSLTCTNGMCVGATGGDSCNPADYAVPAVPIGLLPGNASAITSSMSAQVPNTNTPQAVALQGALTYAKSFAMTHPTHHVGVLMVTDGLPNECTPNTNATDTANVAAMFANGSPPVHTYVIGVGQDNAQAEWTSIAIAGGTGKAYFAPAPSSAEVSTALAQVRAAFATCP